MLPRLLRRVARNSTDVSRLVASDGQRNVDYCTSLLEAPLHREFKRLLGAARGVSEFVIALNVDIRGFSGFSMKVDSSETAMYVKRVYAEILDEYFRSAKFFKPTGDGLLIVLDFDEDSLEEVAHRAVDDSLRLINDFAGLTAGDPMINFTTPEFVGVGISRGAACRLVSGRKTLDYSGRVLNMASRLMALARPSGVVVDSSFGAEFLGERAGSFSSETVFLRGIAEDEPVTIYYTADHTTIPEVATRPLVPSNWRHDERLITLKETKGERVARQTFNLEAEPEDSSRIKVEVAIEDPRD